MGKGWQERLDKTLPALALAGLWGVEAYSSEIDEKGHTEIARLAARHGLRVTGGSDSHGRLKTYARLGTVRRADGVDYKGVEGWVEAGLAGDRLLHDEAL